MTSPAPEEKNQWHGRPCPWTTLVCEPPSKFRVSSRGYPKLSCRRPFHNRPTPFFPSPDGRGLKVSDIIQRASFGARFKDSALLRSRAGLCKVPSG
jgi:hypothetical protein